MRRAGVFGFVVCSAFLCVGCGGGEAEKPALESPAKVGDDPAAGEPRLFTARGCLTGVEDRFVLTDLDRGVQGPEVAEKRGERPAAEPEPTTESYRLVGVDAEQLRPLIGQRVEITGALEPEQVVDVRESAPPSRPSNEGATGTAGADPRVSTTESTRLEISDLAVRSVKPMGEACTAKPQ